MSSLKVQYINEPTFKFEKIENKKFSVIYLKKNCRKYLSQKNIIAIKEKSIYECEIELESIYKFLDHCAETNEMPFVNTICQPAIDYLTGIVNYLNVAGFSGEKTQDKIKYLENRTRYHTLYIIFKHPSPINKKIM